MSEALFPRTPGDVESAYLANVAYQNGRWLAFAVDGNPTGEQRVLLGGDFDDRALDDLGYDGTVVVQDKRLFEPHILYVAYNDYVDGRALSPAQQRHAELRRLHEFYTSPVVREPERLASKIPAEVSSEPDNILWAYNGKANSMASTFGTEPQQLFSGGEVKFDGDEHAYFTMTIPDGKRLVVDAVPRGKKNAPDEPTPCMQVHIYPNTNGFLVADKILGGRVLGRKRPVATKRNEGVLQIDQDTAPEGQDLYPSDDKKQEFRDPLNPGRKKVQLLSTTAQWSMEEVPYARMEITVATLDDAGRTVHIELGQSDHLPTPILFRLVDDTTEELHPLFQ